MLFITVTQESDLDDYTCVARNGQSSPTQRLVRLSMRGKCMLFISVIQEVVKVCHIWHSDPYMDRLRPSRESM
jgi:hypothetical protein